MAPDLAWRRRSDYRAYPIAPARAPPITEVTRNAINKPGKEASTRSLRAVALHALTAFLMIAARSGTLVCSISSSGMRSIFIPIVSLTCFPLGEAFAGDRHQMGLASFYHRGQSTASGDPFDLKALTAAHRTLPFGTRVRVIMLATGKAVIVRINDRGPFIKGRVIDVSRRAAEVLGMAKAGIARVRVEIVESANERTTRQ
jgi:rare lipoprotein A